jgi:hypothetical protein
LRQISCFIAAGEPPPCRLNTHRLAHEVSGGLIVALPTDYELAMQRLRGAGAVIVSPEMVAFEWLHDGRHPSFKPVLQIFKTPIG